VRKSLENKRIFDGIFCGIFAQNSQNIVDKEKGEVF